MCGYDKETLLKVARAHVQWVFYFDLASEVLPLTCNRSAVSKEIVERNLNQRAQKGTSETVASAPKVEEEEPLQGNRIKRAGILFRKILGKWAH